MAQLVAEELESSWKDMTIMLASNDPKYNDPILGAQVTGGSWSTGMNFDTMCRAGAAGRHHADQGRRRDAGRAGRRAARAKIARSSRQVEEEPDVCADRAERKGQQGLVADELKAIQLKTPDQYTKIGQSLPQLDIPSKTNGTCKYGIDARVPGMLYGKLASSAGALRRDGEVG